MESSICVARKKIALSFYFFSLCLSGGSAILCLANESQILQTSFGNKTKGLSLDKDEVIPRLLVVQDRCFLVPALSISPGVNVTITTREEAIIESSINRIIHLPGLRGSPERNYPVSAVSSEFFGTFEAAAQADKTVISMDETVRQCFRELTKKIRPFAVIVWVNPCINEETPLDWLKNGAEPECERLLGYQREDT